MDRIDMKIIEHLCRDGRVSNAELASRVGLTAAPCLRRVRQLERSGVITGYHAEVAPGAVGRGFEVVVHVDLRAKDRSTVTEFENAVARFPEVADCRRMFGSPDYIIRVTTADLKEFEAFVTDQLEATPGVGRVDSHLTMKLVCATPGR